MVSHFKITGLFVFDTIPVARPTQNCTTAIDTYGTLYGKFRNKLDISIKNLKTTGFQIGINFAFGY